MRSCRSPAGRLESHQRGFWIETLFQMQKTKALNWLFPENVGRVEKQADSYSLGVDAQEIPGGKPEVWLALPSELCRMTLSRVEFLTLAPDRGAWWAAVLGVVRSRTLLSDFTFIFHFPLSFIREGSGNPLQCSCLENPRDGGAWWASVYGVAQTQTLLKQLSSSSKLRIYKMKN